MDEKIEATIADPANDPEVALQEKDRGELVRRALMRLSIEHREVIDLVYYHEKSVDEVAHILDLPPATVKTRMFYARKKLAKLVNGACTSSSPNRLIPASRPLMTAPPTGIDNSYGPNRSKPWSGVYAWAPARRSISPSVVQCSLVRRHDHLADRPKRDAGELEMRPGKWNSDDRHGKKNRHDDMAERQPPPRQHQPYDVSQNA